MRCPPWIRVVFGLSLAGTPGVAAVPFTPWAAPIALPENLHGKAVWALQRLPDGRLAAGFEGGVALGVPGGNWSIVPTPNGSPVQNIVAAHHRMLAVGGGCVGFVEQGRFEPIDGVAGQVGEVIPVPEGWLLTVPNGLWLVPIAGPARALGGDRWADATPSLGRWHDQVLVLGARRPPSRWLDGALSPWEAPPGLAGLHPRLLRDELWFTESGILDASALPLLPATVAENLLEQAGLLGSANGVPWILCATYWNGIQGYAPAAAAPAWSWKDLGACYAFSRAGDNFLVGSVSGAFGLADPNRVRIAKLDGSEILHLEAAHGGARVVTFGAVVDLGEADTATPNLLWPEVGGATVADGVLTFRGQSIQLPTRFLNGLAACGDTAAAAFGNTVLITGPGSPLVTALSGGASSLATDGHEFFVGTHTEGVRVFTPDGQPREPIGAGRAKVRELEPGRLALLFWSGEVRGAQGGLLGQVPLGNPRDAALVSVRTAHGGLPQTRQLAVLTTRPDGPPVVALLGPDRWQPLDLPDLSLVGAEAIAADAEHLYIAGRRGVLELRMPLSIDSPAVPIWHWSDGSAGPTFTLPRSRTEHVQITAGEWAVPTGTGTRYTFILPDGEALEAVPGVPRSLPVGWGSNRIQLQAERSGLRSNRELVVRRPYPWALQPWALVLEALLLGGAMWATARWRTRRLTRRTRELEAAVEQRTQELSKANRAKQEFLASVSHEIRNPLNGVVGICAILQDSPLEPRERNFVGVLSGCAQQLSSMLDDVLDFSRIDRGEITLHPTEFELRSLVEEAVRVMDPMLESCSLQLPDLPQWLSGDAGKIRQIVCNLVSNALKYGQPREAGIEVRITPRSDRRAHLRIVVSNTGPTIPPDELPRLFESFRRGGDTSGTPGFGLGLAVCHRLAERMGGRMAATSADRATEFAFEVELAVATPPLGHDTRPMTPSRALAIEDEDYNRIALGHALRSLGFTVDWAVDGASALQLARQQSYDLILTDWKLPDIDGDELCRQLLATLVPPRPPIVAVTAYSSAEKQAAAREAGMSGFVTKPVTPAKLEQLIRNIDIGPRPRPGSDVPPRKELPEALKLLGDLGPTIERLTKDLTAGWKQVEDQAGLRDPRAGRAAHALRSLLLLAAEGDLAEQVGLLERACNNQDWETAARLLPFLAEEIQAALARLAASR